MTAAEPRYVAPADWTGRAEDRPGLMWRKAQIQEYLASLDPEPERPVFPDRVLAHRVLPASAEAMAELAELCGGAKAAFGVTLKTPRGQLGPGWRWSGHHGFGINGTTGAVTESLALKLRNTERESGALFYWTRPVPDPRLVHALAWQHCGADPDVGEPMGWPLVAAALGQLPAPTWSAEFTSSWTTEPSGLPDDMPRAVPSAAVKKEIRS